MLNLKLIKMKKEVTSNTLMNISIAILFVGTIVVAVSLA